MINKFSQSQRLVHRWIFNPGRVNEFQENIRCISESGALARKERRRKVSVSLAQDFFSLRKVMCAVGHCSLNGELGGVGGPP